MNFRRAGLVIVIVIMVALFFLNRKDVTLVKQDNFSVTPIGETGYLMSSVLRLNNPNLLSSTIKIISQKYFIEGREVALMNVEVNQGIPGMKETSFPVNVRFSKEDLLDIFPKDSTLCWYSAGSTIKAEVIITGEITFANMMSSGKISVNQKDSITISGL